MDTKVSDLRVSDNQKPLLEEKYNIKFVFLCKLFEKMVGNKNKMKYLVINLEW